MIEKALQILPLALVAAAFTIPILCVVLYRRRKLRTCIVFSHLWCMITFCLLQMFLVITLRRHFSERADCADKADRVLTICQTLREGDIEKSTLLLDSYLAGALHLSAYDIPDSKMSEVDPDILWVWQKAKEYFDTYDVNEPSWGMMPNVRSKLRHVPWSDMQLAIKKFEQTYGSGKCALAPAVTMKSWITRPISNEELKNKVVLLDFWNTHCGPCVKSLPELQRIHDAYHDMGLVVIACAGGNKEETEQFLDKHGYRFPAGMVAWETYLDYAVRGNPSYFLIDRRGFLVWGPEHRLPTDQELTNSLNGKAVIPSESRGTWPTPDR
ncbi:MAG: TlpA family protein disulfide reductase [Sedimentisphaerales bacterium]|nr:TlpA family protein disulfide reductase [Sedimentisphaerales bacterium]